MACVRINFRAKPSKAGNVRPEQRQRGVKQALNYYTRAAGPAGTLHRAPVGQGPPGPDWLAIFLGFWSGRALATGTAWAGLYIIHHHQLQASSSLVFSTITRNLVVMASIPNWVTTSDLGKENTEVPGSIPGAIGIRLPSLSGS